MNDDITRESDTLKAESETVVIEPEADPAVTYLKSLARAARRIDTNTAIIGIGIISLGFTVTYAVGVISHEIAKAGHAVSDLARILEAR